MPILKKKDKEMIISFNIEDMLNLKSARIDNECTLLMSYLKETLAITEEVLYYILMINNDYIIAGIEETKLLAYRSLTTEMYMNTKYKMFGIDLLLTSEELNIIYRLAFFLITKIIETLYDNFCYRYIKCEDFTINNTVCIAEFSIY